MRTLDFYFDPVSPYAYLAFEALPQALQGHSCSVRYCPVLLGSLLQHWGQLAPAQIDPKRQWIYRHVFWQAHEMGFPMQIPSVHPFQSVKPLRFLVEHSLQNHHSAADTVVYCNRFAAETVLRYVWNNGLAPLDEERLAGLREQLGLPQEQAQGILRERIRLGLRTNTSYAVEQAVFGVPSMVLDGVLFWGVDALPMLTRYLHNPDSVKAGQWEALSQIKSGL